MRLLYEGLRYIKKEPRPSISLNFPVATIA